MPGRRWFTNLASETPTPQLSRGKRVELDRDAVAEAAGLAADHTAVSVPAAVHSLRWEEDGQLFTATERRLADRAQPAERQVSQREAQLRLAQRLERVVVTHAVDPGVNLLAGKHAALRA